MTRIKNVILALLSAVLTALLTAAIWTYVPLRVATTLGADEEVALVFFLVGPIIGAMRKTCYHGRYYRASRDLSRIQIQHKVP